MSTRFENARLVWGVLAKQANCRSGPVRYTCLREPLGLDSGQIHSALKVVHVHCKANRLPQLDALAIGRGHRIPTGYGAPRTKMAHDAMLRKVWATTWNVEPPERWSSELLEQADLESGASAE